MAKWLQDPGFAPPRIQYHTVRGYERIWQRNIHFAGEHCSVEFQGYMEGGATEGIRAANEVRRDLGA
jgi:monoamine oxidase